MMRSPAHLNRKILGAALCACVCLLAGCRQEPWMYHATVSGAAKESASQSTKTASYDLARDEQRGGHTLARHVRRSDAELRERLEQERNISAASTWTNREIAEETVAAGLQAEHGRIENWERRGERRANLALHFAAGRTIGRSLRRGDANTVLCSEAVIVLRADGANTFYVLTTYPEARR